MHWWVVQETKHIGGYVNKHSVSFHSGSAESPEAQVFLKL